MHRGTVRVSDRGGHRRYCCGPPCSGADERPSREHVRANRGRRDACARRIGDARNRSSCCCSCTAPGAPDGADAVAAATATATTATQHPLAPCRATHRRTGAAVRSACATGGGIVPVGGRAALRRGVRFPTRTVPHAASVRRHTHTRHTRHTHTHLHSGGARGSDGARPRHRTAPRRPTTPTRHRRGGRPALPQSPSCGARPSRPVVCARARRP